MKTKNYLFALTFAVASSTTHAGEAAFTPFVAGEAATASGVNTVFQALVDAINDNNSRIAALESSSSTHGSNISDLQADSTDHGTRVSTLETSSSNHASSISALESSSSNHASRISTLESSSSDHDSRIDWLEGRETNSVAGRIYHLEQVGMLLRGRESTAELDASVTIAASAQGYTLTFNNDGTYVFEGTESLSEVETSSGVVSLFDLGTAVPTVNDTYTQDSREVTLNGLGVAFQVALNGSVLILKEFKWGEPDDPGWTRTEHSLVIGIERQ